MAQSQEWIIRINLGVMDGGEADQWYNHIEHSLMLLDPGFSGLLSMTLEPVPNEGPIIPTPEGIADVGDSKDTVPPALAWKHAFLSLQDAIESLQGRYLQWVVDYTPPSEAPENGNTAKLLHYHLDRCRELLWAEVQGGLDAEYQDEVDALAKTTAPIQE